MKWGLIWLLLLAVFLFFILPTFIMAWVLYSILLRRTKPEKFGRECSFPEDEEYVRMYNIGLEWGEKYAGYKKPVEIVSEGLRLVGEFFDFGGDSAVLIIAGRTESLLYSYYFADPFRQAGRNILVIDNRAHGLSEGKVSSLGQREYMDLLRWCALLHDVLGQKRVFLHGVCIGASAALFALTSEGCPDYIEGMSAEGMYYSFYRSFDNHMKADRPDKMRFPIMQEVMLYIRLFSGANVVTDGPFKRIGLMKKPILFLYSKEDVYSTSDQAEYLYSHCTAPGKKLVWFDRGAHSRIRINDTEGYDRTLKDFLADLI
ncbi:MAG: hypothetical protein IJU01_03725 [Lachnospiraceae bacterium]|nr:hypothetical protein [Lachnospiraceae bacterium]